MGVLLTDSISWLTKLTCFIKCVASCWELKNKKAGFLPGEVFILFLKALYYKNESCHSFRTYCVQSPLLGPAHTSSLILKPWFYGWVKRSCRLRSSSKGKVLVFYGARFQTQGISQGPVWQTECLPAIQRGNFKGGTLRRVLEELENQGERKWSGD